MNTISQSEILLQDATKEVGYFLHRLLPFTGSLMIVTLGF